MGAVSFILKKAAVMLASFYVISTVIFLLPRLTPIDPKTLLADNPRIPPNIRQDLIASFGLNKPLIDQYLSYYTNLFGGNLGYSFLYREPVFTVLLTRLPWTILLLGMSTAIFIALGIVIGVLQASRYGSKFDVAALVVSLTASSFPFFWVGIIFIYLFAFVFPLFPTFGAMTPGVTFASPIDTIADIGWHLVLPAITIVIVNISRYSFYLRNIMVGVLSEDYIVTARAKGLTQNKVLFKHGLRNALLPTMTMMAMDFGFIIAGAIFVETVFSYPGVGSLAYQAILNADYPLMNGEFILLSIVILAANFTADALYSVLDPRIRKGS
ncbi:MAG TPA: ABC transporter permease [Candidatus Acidoferrales bacterium]|nr:ABC transporter permease [Candidatus Acidoferrales bacterium]